MTIKRYLIIRTWYFFNFLKYIFYFFTRFLNLEDIILIILDLNTLNQTFKKMIFIYLFLDVQSSVSFERLSYFYMKSLNHFYN